MDFKEMFKKFWFVFLISLALFGFIIYYAYTLINQNEKSEIDTKVVDGKTVIYSLGDNNFFAEDLFEMLNENTGASIAYDIYKRNVVASSMKTTSQMRETAANYAAYMLQYYGEDQLLPYLKQYGYSSIDDLTDLYVNQIKENELVSSFLLENTDKYITPKISDYDLKNISHILIKVADVEEAMDANGNTIHIAHPTAEEEEKLNAVLNDLQTKSFEEVAMEYSEDGSASSGGYLGVVGTHNSSSYVQEFADECLRLSAGEVSDVITTTYGYHIIYAFEADAEDILTDSTLYETIYNESLSEIFKLIYDKGNELGFKIIDEALKKYIEDNINGSEVSE